LSYCLNVFLSEVLKTPSHFPPISPENAKALLLGGKSITFSAKSITSASKSIAFTSPPRKPRKHWAHESVKYPVFTCTKPKK
ncbi:MAG: hypothetical protein II055_01725, partial [Prevotella sp.]|nr:hypothetical protein [Prevotella sp.]